MINHIDNLEYSIVALVESDNELVVYKNRKKLAKLITKKRKY